MMKRTIICIVAALAYACSSVSPDAGHESVLTRKPMFVGYGGIDQTPVLPGRKYVAWTTDAQDVSMLPQRVDMAFDDMMTKSGVPVNFHVVLTFRVTDAVKLVEKFGGDRENDDATGSHWGFFLRNLDQPIRTAVRDSVKQRDMNEIAISTTAVDQVQAEVRAATEKLVAASGVPVAIVELNVGRVNPPDAIKNQRVETATQEQRIITEQQRKLAEDQRKAAEEARAAADVAYNDKMRLSPEQYVQLESIRAMREVCSGGHCTFVTSGALPTFGIK